MWGLFKEPLYPFLLLELATADVAFSLGFELPGGAWPLSARPLSREHSRARLLTPRASAPHSPRQARSA